MTSAPSAQRLDQPTLFAVDSPAKTSAQQVNKPASKSAPALASSMNSCELFAWFDRATSSWRTSQRSPTTGWMPYSGSWPKQGLMRNGRAYGLQILGPFIGATDGGLLPTPSATEAKGTCSRRYPGSDQYKGSRVSEALRTCESDPLLTHPVFCEELMGFPTSWTDCEHLGMQLSLRLP
jgi:hypothetical protein